MSVRIFEGKKHANLYSKFRPIVPQNIIEIVLKFLGYGIPPNQWRIGVDVGCGTGQATNLLSRYFKKVYGFDVSPAQISEAKESKLSSNIYFYVSEAENLSKIESNSVQLVTAVEAAHWFDQDEFFKEADRIVVDRGVVAFIGYMMPDPIDPDNPHDIRVTELMRNAYFDERLAPHKNPKIVPIESHYRNFQFPNNYQFVHKDNIRISYEERADTLIGFVESLSLFQGLAKTEPKVAQKFIEEFEENLKSILKTNELSEKKLIFNYDFFIAMGRKIGQGDSNNNEIM